MKKITLIVCSLFAVTLFACKKTNVGTKNEDALYENSPSSTVPAGLAKGVWFYGTVSAISYWDRNGHRLGNDYEAGREYQFSNVNGQGRMKFYQYLGTRNASHCVTEILTYKEGTVVFNGDTFTFHPVKGNFKTIKKDCSTGNGTSVRNAAGNDIKTVTYRWEIKEFDNKTYFYTYLEGDVEHKDVLFVYQFSN